MTAIMLIELLNDEEVLKKFKQVLFPQALADRIDNMNIHITNLSMLLNAKDTRVNELGHKGNYI